MLVEEYLPLAIFATIAVVFPALGFWASRFFRPRKKETLKNTTYECGEIPIGEAQIQFHVQFYIFAIIFVIFDVTIAFLMIWAVVFSNLPDLARIYLAIFLGILLVGVGYALRKERVIWI